MPLCVYVTYFALAVCVYFMRGNALLLAEYRPREKSGFLGQKYSIGGGGWGVNEEMKTAGCRVKKMLDIMALL